MTGYYLKFNDGDDFELYGNLKLGSKKLKQQDWFVVEPQTLSFDLLYFNSPQNGQQEISNTIIDSIFVNNTLTNGIVQNAIIKLYYGETILFTGIVDLSQCDYDKITKDAKLFCYDYLRFLSMIKEDGYEIIDDYISLISPTPSFSLRDKIQDKIDEYNIVDIDVSVSANLPIIDIDETISTNQIYPMAGSGATLLSKYGFISGFGNYSHLKMFIFCRIERIFLEDNNIHTRAEYSLMGIYGLCYKEYFHEATTIPTNSGGAIGSTAYNNLIVEIQAKYTEYQVGFFPTYDYPLTANIDSINYSFSESTVGETNSLINITGSSFISAYVFGKYLDEGYNSENKSKLNDIFKMFLKANDLMCYTYPGGIQIIDYSHYGATITISDSDDILSVKGKYIEKKLIDEIEVSPENNKIWLSVLNDYYSDNISSDIVDVKILLSGNENIKAGDRIINAAYDLDLFVMELKLNIDKSYIEVTGVSI